MINRKLWNYLQERGLTCARKDYGASKETLEVYNPEDEENSVKLLADEDGFLFAVVDTDSELAVFEYSPEERSWMLGDVYASIELGIPLEGITTSFYFDIRTISTEIRQSKPLQDLERALKALKYAYGKLLKAAVKTEYDTSINLFFEQGRGTLDNGHFDVVSHDQRLTTNVRVYGLQWFSANTLCTWINCLSFAFR